uniref:KH-like RNA-binding domain-containing protein n=1 Tax=Canis lupus dingo TaxID=286419 RepID=A0A8C0KSS7_CANLU
MHGVSIFAPHLMPIYSTMGESSGRLERPVVLQVQMQLLETMFGPAGSRILYIEQVSKVMLELKVLESSGLTEVLVYGSYLYKLRWHRQRQERGMLKLEDAMKALQLGPWMK